MSSWWQRIEGVTFRVCPDCKYAQRFAESARAEANWYSCRRCKMRLPHWRWVPQHGWDDSLHRNRQLPNIVRALTGEQKWQNLKTENLRP